MDEQTNSEVEPVVTTPDPVVAAAAPATEPPQAEPAQTPTEPEAVAETPQIEATSEPLAAAAERPQGPLPFSKTDDRQENLVAPKVETPKPSSTPTANTRTPEETPPKTEEPPRTQQGTPQPEPARQQEPPASHPAPLPAQAPTETPKNILLHLLTKAHLVTQLRKQKKLVKIMTLFAKMNHITNDDVEKLLHVSDATASRYLGQLTKENKITQFGKTGQGVTYTKR